MQWGRFLRIQSSTEALFSLNDRDLEFLLAGIRLVYDKWQVPHEGALPGFTIVSGEGENEKREPIPIWIPPVSVDCLSTNWMDLLMISYQGTIYERPVRGGNTLPPLDLEEGLTFVSTSSKLMTFCVDMGYLVATPLMETVVFDDESLRQELQMLEGVAGEIMYEFRCRTSPSWYFEVAVRYHPSLLNEEPHEALSRVTSIFG
jgi:hypothetical protein